MKQREEAENLTGSLQQVEMNWNRPLNTRFFFFFSTLLFRFWSFSSGFPLKQSQHSHRSDERRLWCSTLLEMKVWRSFFSPSHETCNSRVCFWSTDAWFAVCLDVGLLIPGLRLWKSSSVQANRTLNGGWWVSPVGANSRMRRSWMSFSFRGLRNLDFTPLPVFFSVFFQSHRLEYHTHTHTHMPLPDIHACVSVSSFFFLKKTKKLTAVLQKSKQFARGYLDSPSIHSWELQAPGGSIMRRLLILGFSITNSGWIPFHLAASQMAQMGKKRAEAESHCRAHVEKMAGSCFWGQNEPAAAWKKASLETEPFDSTFCCFFPLIPVEKWTQIVKMWGKLFPVFSFQ